MQFQYEAALRPRPEEFATVRAIREIGRLSASQSPGNSFRLSVCEASSAIRIARKLRGTGQAVPFFRSLPFTVTEVFVLPAFTHDGESLESSHMLTVPSLFWYSYTSPSDSPAQ